MSSRRGLLATLVPVCVLGALVALIAAPGAAASPFARGDTLWVRRYTEASYNSDIAAAVAVSLCRAWPTVLLGCVKPRRRSSVV